MTVSLRSAFFALHLIAHQPGWCGGGHCCDKRLSCLFFRKAEHGVQVGEGQNGADARLKRQFHRDKATGGDGLCRCQWRLNQTLEYPTYAVLFVDREDEIDEMLGALRTRLSKSPPGIKAHRAIGSPRHRLRSLAEEYSSQLVAVHGFPLLSACGKLSIFPIELPHSVREWQETCRTYLRLVRYGDAVTTGKPGGCPTV